MTTGDRPADEDEKFAKVIGTLMDGTVVFRPPFDAATAASLTDNPRGGDHTPVRRIRISVHEVIDTSGEPIVRELVNCEVPAALASGLLMETAFDLDPH